MSGNRDEEDFDFFSKRPSRRSEKREAPRAPAAGPARARRGRRSDAGTGRRSLGDSYTQISARVDRTVKAEFDVALARERADSGRRTDQSEVIEGLMRFFAERGDPYEALKEARREQREGR